MTRKISHFPTAPPVVMAITVMRAKRLLITEKSSALVAGDRHDSSLENLSVRSAMMTRTLRKFEGYNHYGINE